MIVFDTDILSMFAKTDAIDLRKRLFGERAVITPKIRDKISVPMEYGYTFPLKVILTIKTVPPKEKNYAEDKFKLENNQIIL